MPKLYYPTPDELQGARPLDERLWFQRNQQTLLALANTREGRDLLCLDSHGESPVIKLTKNMAQYDLGGGQRLSDVRVGAKWGNVVRSRWAHIRPALARLSLAEVLTWAHLGSPVRLAAARFTTTTVYPDPNVESASVDGYTLYSGAEVANWAVLRATAAGTATDDVAGPAQFAFANAGTTSNQYDQLYRYFCLFNTGDIDSGDTKVSATLELYITHITNDLGGSHSMSMVTSDPASDTALVTGDHDTLGTTIQAPNRTLASMSTSSYEAWTLNATGLGNVDLTGISKFGIVLTLDLADSPTPTWGSNETIRIAGHHADYSDTTTDPKLVVVHTSPFTPRAMMF
jgi:hypothetical protein